MDKERRGAAFRLLGLGWYVGICLVGSTLIGVFLDRSFSSVRFPVFTVSGLIVGQICAFAGVYVMVTSVLNKPNR